MYDSNSIALLWKIPGRHLQNVISAIVADEKLFYKMLIRDGYIFLHQISQAVNQCVLRFNFCVDKKPDIMLAYIGKADYFYISIRLGNPNTATQSPEKLRFLSLKKPKKRFFEMQFS